MTEIARLREVLAFIEKRAAHGQGMSPALAESTLRLIEGVARKALGGKEDSRALARATVTSFAHGIRVLAGHDPLYRELRPHLRRSLRAYRTLERDA